MRNVSHHTVCIRSLSFTRDQKKLQNQVTQAEINITLKETPAVIDLSAVTIYLNSLLIFEQLITLYLNSSFCTYKSSTKTVVLIPKRHEKSSKSSITFPLFLAFAQKY